MLCNSKNEHRIARLKEQIRIRPALTSDLVSNVIADACIRFPVLKKAGKTSRIEELIEAEAWTEAFIGLIELELPAWRLRRLIYEDGEWFCSLSRYRHVPVELDDTADARHEELPLSILSAFLEARRMACAMPQFCTLAAPELPSITGHAVCCDNFG